VNESGRMQNNQASRSKVSGSQSSAAEAENYRKQLVNFYLRGTPLPKREALDLDIQRLKEDKSKNAQADIYSKSPARQEAGLEGRNLENIPPNSYTEAPQSAPIFDDVLSDKKDSKISGLQEDRINKARKFGLDSLVIEYKPEDFTGLDSLLDQLQAVVVLWAKRDHQPSDAAELTFRQEFDRALVDAIICVSINYYNYIEHLANECHVGLTPMNRNHLASGLSEKLTQQIYQDPNSTFTLVVVAEGVDFDQDKHSLGGTGTNESQAKVRPMSFGVSGGNPKKPIVIPIRPRRSYISGVDG